MKMVYMTTPAILFHVLRQQVHPDFRKPKLYLQSYEETKLILLS